MSDGDNQLTMLRLTRGDAARRTAEAWRLRTEQGLPWPGLLLNVQPVFEPEFGPKWLEQELQR